MEDAYIGTIVLWSGGWVPRGWALCDGTLLGVNNNAALFSILGTRFGGNGTTTFGLPDLRNRVPVGTMQSAQNPTPSGTVSTTAGSLAATGTVAMSAVAPHTHTGSATVPAQGLVGGTLSLPVTGTGSVTATGSASIATTDSAAAGSKTPTPNSYLVQGGAAATIYGTTSSAVSTFAIGSNSAVQVSGTASITGTASGTPAGLQVAIPAVAVNVGTSAGAPTIQNIGLQVAALPLNYIICVSGLYPSRN